MKRFVALVAAFFLIAVPLSSCTTFGQLTNNPQAATYDERALVTVELSYEFLLNGIGQAVSVGAINQERAQIILPRLRQLNAAIVEARRLYDAGERVDAAAATRNAVVLVSEITNLLVEYGVLVRS